jgi:hypothetical protein
MTNLERELLEALVYLLPTAENWACVCEINGAGKNNPGAVACAHARRVIAKANQVAKEVTP